MLCATITDADQVGWDEAGPAGNGTAGPQGADPSTGSEAWPGASQGGASTAHLLGSRTPRRSALHPAQSCHCEQGPREEELLLLRLHVSTTWAYRQFCSVQRTSPSDFKHSIPLIFLTNKNIIITLILIINIY